MATAIKRISDGKIVIECSEEELMHLIAGLYLVAVNAPKVIDVQIAYKLIDEIAITPAAPVADNF